MGANYEKAKTKLTEVKTAMLLYVPFFASLYMDMMKSHVGKFPHVFGSRPATAATDGKNIWFDEDFLAGLKLPEAVFLTCHEIGHAMWEHMARAKKYEATGLDGKEFNHGKWNRAGDYVINDMLVAAGVGTMPKGGLHSKKYTHKDWMADDVYRDLDDEDGDGGGGSGTLDTHVPAPDSGASGAEWKRAIATAAEAAKAKGDLPDALARIVDKLLNPTIPWQELLRTILMRAISRDSLTWARPHRRRLITQGVVLPSYTGFGAGVVVVAVDTSGSIGERELVAFLTELQNILDVAKPELVYLVPCDAAVHTVTELDANDDIIAHRPVIDGGGGTAFEPVFEWVEKEGIKPSALVYLTDMLGSFPDEAPPYTTIWCSTSKGVKGPFGNTIEINIEDYHDDE